MSEPVSSPLIELIKERGLIDDLQYEEVSQEVARGSKSPIQVIQDFGIMDLDSLLQAMADYLGTEVVSLRDVDFNPELLKTVSAGTARMYECIPVALHGS